MVEMIEFNDNTWGRCIQIKNNQVELMVPHEFGPRVMRYAFIGAQNHFAEFPDHKTSPEKDKWHSYGGHRLWHGPEDLVRTYLPDNDPVTIDGSAAAIIIKQAIEPQTQLQKEMEIQLDPSDTHVKVIHRIHNNNLFDIRLSVWAVSVMGIGGCAILPLPPRGSHDFDRQAQTSLNLWAYTDLSDKRWQFQKKYIIFKQDPSNSESQKIGISYSDGWLSYINNNEAFIKKCQFLNDQSYQDEGSSLEIYADHKCLELESLSPLTYIEPGGVAELIEDWYLIKGINENAEETEIDHQCLAFIKSQK